MREPLAIATSDTHLQDTTWVDRRALRGDSFFSFSQIISLAVDYRCPVLAAGDLINRRRNESSVPGFLRGELDRLARADCRFYYIQGQHELQYPTPWLSAVHSLPTWVDAEYQPEPLVIGSSRLRVTGLDWRPVSRLPEALEKLPRADLVLLHQVCKELMGMGLHELELASVPYSRLAVVGDFHVHRQLSLTGGSGQQVTVLSPGSTAMQKIDESPEKYVYLLYDDLSYESLPLRTRPFRSLQLDSQADLDGFVLGWPRLIEQALDEAADLPDDLRKPVVDVVYGDDVPEAYVRITQAVGDDAHLFLKVLRGSQQSRPASQVPAGETGSLVDCLADWVDKEKEPALYSMLYRMLTCPDGSERQELFASREEYAID